MDKDEKIDKNPAVFVNPEQPLISSLEVQDEDITAQEEKVKEARGRLAQAIKALGWARQSMTITMQWLDMYRQYFLFILGLFRHIFIC